MKGVIDSGVHVPFSDEALPSEDRLKGSEHRGLRGRARKAGQGSYTRSASQHCIRLGFKPEDYTQNYDHTKDAILGADK